jgi:transcription elongation factor GreA-like protein/transcription elongation GreA/GreB family factor
MAYLEQIRESINKSDLQKVLNLWEEYCNGDEVDVEELKSILRLLRDSEMATKFGTLVEMAIPLWSKIQDPKASYDVLAGIVDIETGNTEVLKELVTKMVTERYGKHADFNQWMRLVGLRGGDSFQGALSRMELLAHLVPGKFVFHRAGWGTGEVLEMSLLREQVNIEFENLQRPRDLSFVNAFKTLDPLPNDHFLSRRFGNADALEKEARRDPNAVIRLLLRDLGPKTAAEIKDEMCELVIPEADWSKWWQTTRSRLKKDSLIDAPATLKDSYKLHEEEVSHADRFHEEIHKTGNIDKALLATYNYLRDFPATLKDESVRKSVLDKLEVLVKDDSLQPFQDVQISLLYEMMNETDALKGRTIKEFIEKFDNIAEMVHQIDILAFKKRMLQAIKKERADWGDIFISHLFGPAQNPTRDYLYKELRKGQHETAQFKKKIEPLFHHPKENPDAFVWYFQKLLAGEGVGADTKSEQLQGLESLLVLLSDVEQVPELRDVTKKIYNLLIADRYVNVRNLIQNTSLNYIKEFLLLVTKCQTMTDHDIKIMRSLAEVVHPSLAEKVAKPKDENIIWTTEQGFNKAKERAQQIGTSEMVQNAREIEAARALGDLRENAEYKSAQERRARLQSELRELSEKLNKARVITPQDIVHGEVCVGTTIHVKDSKGHSITYTILGPWEANPDENILSFQSKFAEAMIGCKVGDIFSFRGEDYEVTNIATYI